MDTPDVMPGVTALFVFAPDVVEVVIGLFVFAPVVIMVVVMYVLVMYVVGAFSMTTVPPLPKMLIICDAD